MGIRPLVPFSPGHVQQHPLQMFREQHNKEVTGVFAFRADGGADDEVGRRGEGRGLEHLNQNM